MLKKYCLLTLLFIAAVCAGAQTDRGSIAGTVSNTATGEPVEGASVIVENAGKWAVTDSEGKFAVEKLPAGRFKIKVMSVSCEPVEVEADIVAGITTTVNVKMYENATALEEITVSTLRRHNTELSVIADIKSATGVVSGISSQQISRTQDRDASEVIRRIPGIAIIDSRFIIARGLAQRYNSVWINNCAVPASEADSRSFSFDMIPGGQIDNIMIVKSPAPELPADFTGGFVKIATKNMPDENSLQISYGAAINTSTHFSDFSHAAGSPTDFLGFDNGFRAMKSVVPDERMDGANSDQVTDVTRNGFNNNWSVKLGKPLPDQRFSIMLNRCRNVGKRRLGLVTALNYSYASIACTDMTSARFGIYDKREDKPVYLYKYNDSQFSSTARIGAMLNLTLMFSENHRIEFRNIFNQTGRDRYTARDGWQNISSFYRQKKEEYIYTSRGTYSGQFAGTHELDKNAKIDWTAGYSCANRNQPDRRQADREEEADGRFAINSIIRDFNRLDEYMYSAGLNFCQSFDFGSFAPSLKAGLYAEYRSREYSTRYFIYKMKMANLPDDFPYRNLADGIMQNEYFAADKLFISDASDKTNNYSGDGLLYSGYAGISLPLGKLSLYAGIRYENSTMSLLNYLTITGDRRETLDYKAADFFPSINASYSFNSKHLLRFACGKSVNRQEFRELSPSTYYDFDLFSFVRGNRKLKQAYIQNFDLRYEIYPSNGEIISLALFYKRFSNPIEWTYIDAGGSYTFTFENADRADNFGLELDMKKSLDFAGLPDFSISFNGALISSRVKFATGSLEHNRPMQGQSPFIVNTAIFYQRNRLSAGLMYNIIGKRIVGIGRSDNSQGGSIDNNVPDMYEMPRNTFDLTLSYKFGNRIETTLSLRDLLAQPVTYKQFPEFTAPDGKIVQREQTAKEYRTGRGLAIAIKINL
ncbi:MAG: TonB-dependent receptor [Prevotellaceae bacterium]|jgi:outer membrane receptor for ferrienterochelin and colicin|nr:TonB-dependent receptor [Prevotellaceae bacterium]